MNKNFISSKHFNSWFFSQLDKASIEEKKVLVLFYEYVKAHRKSYIFSKKNKEVLDGITSTYTCKEKRVSALSEQTRNQFHEVMNQVAGLKKAEKTAVVPSDGATSRNSAKGAANTLNKKLGYKNKVLVSESDPEFNEFWACLSLRSKMIGLLALYSFISWFAVFIPQIRFLIAPFLFFGRGDWIIAVIFGLLFISLVLFSYSTHCDLMKYRREKKELKK